MLRAPNVLTPNTRPDFLQSDDGQTLVEILRSDEQWNDPQRQMLACHLHCAAAERRRQMLDMRIHLAKCSKDVIEADVTRLDEAAGRLAETRSQLRELEMAEAAQLAEVSELRQRLTSADFLRGKITQRIKHGDTALLRELCKPELEAAEISV